MTTAKKLLHKNDLDLVVKHARTHSPFYKEALKGLPKNTNFGSCPLTQSEDFWAYHNINNISSLAQKDGMIFRSGGTTGSPKYSLYSSEEWNTVCKVAGETFAHNYIEKNDRVANLFYSGSLYGSYLFATKILENCPTPTTHLPVAGHTPPDEIADIIRQFKATVLMGTPSTIVSIAVLNNMRSKNNFDEVSKIFFAGDFFYEDQIKIVKSVFKKAKIYPISYATSDVGLIGYYDKTCEENEYRSIEDYIHVEIVDEKTLKPIKKKNEEGILVVTNLFRQLMPIIRYPAGDKAMWVEDEGARDRKFLLLGRSEEAARVNATKFYVSEIRSILSQFSDQTNWIDFQMIIERKDLKDCLLLRIASHEDSNLLKKFDQKIVKKIIESKTQSEIEEIKDLHIGIEWIKPKDIILNIKTGKIKRVIDNKR